MDAAVERSVVVGATPDEVWAAFAEPDLLEAWFGGEASLEPVVGGRGRFADGAEVRLAEVVEAEEGRRLAWRWWPLGSDRGRAGTVEVDLVPAADGTEVRVREVAPVARVAVGATASAGVPSPVRLHLGDGRASDRAAAPAAPAAWVAPRLHRLAIAGG